MLLVVALHLFVFGFLRHRRAAHWALNLVPVKVWTRVRLSDCLLRFKLPHILDEQRLHMEGFLLLVLVSVYFRLRNNSITTLLPLLLRIGSLYLKLSLDFKLVCYRQALSSLKHFIFWPVSDVLEYQILAVLGHYLYRLWKGLFGLDFGVPEEGLAWLG